MLLIAMFSASPKVVMAGSCGSSSPAAPVSDDFTASSLNTALWTASAPAGGSATVSNGHLLLAVPGGSNHDPSAGGVNNSIRAMQTVANSDFDVAAKFDAAVNLTQYEGEGILVQQDSNNYIRFDYYSDGSARYLNATSMAQGVGATQLSLVVPGGQPYWMQVQRSGNTWTLSGSTDGTHYTSAGSFTLAMTVAQVGPFAWNYSFNPATAPALTASVDYFYNLAAPVPPTCGPSAPVSDDFTASTLNTALWTASAPAGGSATLSNGHLMLAVPGAKNHDPSVGGVNNSVRAMQTISNADFAVAAKFDSAVNVVPYEGEGIFVQQDSSNYIRFQLYSNGSGRYLSASSMVQGTTGATQLFVAVPNAGAPYWISVQRAGNVWTLSGSTDGTHYTSAGSFTLPLTVAQVGPFAWNWNSTPASAQAFTASVDYFYNVASQGTSNGTPAASVNPTSLSFGSVTVGSSSTAGTVTLSNTGTAALTISSISIAGTNPGSFSKTTTCASSLNAGSNCTVAVTFTPTIEGALSATLSIATNASGSPASVALSGTGYSSSGGGTTDGNGTDVTYSTGDAVYPASQSYYNVRNYGAKGDGVTDDTAAIKSAMADALSGAHQPGHGDSTSSTVYFPAGTYKVSQPLMWFQTSTSDPAVITANVDTSRGCITGFNIVHSGSGYPIGYDALSGARSIGLWITGGGGSGPKMPAAVPTGNGGVASINMFGSSCIGQGYTSAPNVQAVFWHPRLRFEGQNKANTTILLADNAPGFTNGNCSISTDENQPRQNCQAVIFTASGTQDSNGAGEAAYINDIWNLTVNTGHGNAGAIGIDWMDSNRGAIKNVNIVSGDGQGRCGLNLSRNAQYGGGGPALVKNVSIQGFDIGIDNNSATHEVGYTLEYINLSHQNQFGVLNGGYVSWFREVSSTNSVPVFVNCAPGVANEYCASNAGSLEVIDGTFSGGSSTQSAVLVQNETSGAGVTFLRNIQTSGYASALATGSSNIPTGGSTITEWAFPSAMAQFPSVMASLNMQNIPNTPEFVDNNFNDWADVSTYGSACQPSSWMDATGCIQAALNSGKPVVFFPGGQYNLSSTLQIPSSVRKIIGSSSLLIGNNGSRVSGPAFSSNSTSGNPVEINNFVMDSGTIPGISQNGSSPLVLNNVWAGGGTLTNTSAGTGTLYLEDFPWASVNLNLASNQAVYGRQVDLENGTSMHFGVSGGKAWVFGFKSEGVGILFNLNNTTAEILGTSGYDPGTGPVGGPIMFTANNSSFSISDSTSAQGWPSGLVSETRNGSTKVMGENGNWGAGNGIGLYSGHN